MDWNQVCEDPVLRDLPYKVELNEWGQVLMSPASNRHGSFQTRIGAKILALTEEGDVISECSIQTTKGVRVADVAWASAEFLQRHAYATPYAAAPEVCVEIVSPGNSAGELAEKTELYFEAGAQEVWLCNGGAMTFLGAQGAMLFRSQVFPGFPDHL